MLPVQPSSSTSGVAENVVVRGGPALRELLGGAALVTAGNREPVPVEVPVGRKPLGLGNLKLAMGSDDRCFRPMDNARSRRRLIFLMVDDLGNVLGRGYLRSFVRSLIQ